MAETPKNLDRRSGLDYAWVRRRQLRHRRRVVHGWLISEPEHVSSRSTTREIGILRLQTAWRRCLLWCLCRPVLCRAPAGWAPLAAKWSSGVGVRFPVAGRRRDHLSEGSRRREAPCSTWRAPRIAPPPLPAHTPRARSRAPCFHHLSPLAPLILAGDARSRWSIFACARCARAAVRAAARAAAELPSSRR